MVEWREKLDFCFLVGLRGCERELYFLWKKGGRRGKAALILRPRISIIDRRLWLGIITLNYDGWTSGRCDDFSIYMVFAIGK